MDSSASELKGVSIQTLQLPAEQEVGVLRFAVRYNTAVPCPVPRAYYFAFRPGQPMND